MALTANPPLPLCLGIYSWFSRYSQDCLKTESCQDRAFEIEQSSNIWIYNLCTKAIKEMISPTESAPTYARDNKNGFLSSVLAWVRAPDDTIGRRQFLGWTVYDAAADADLLKPVPQICKTALTEVIKCDPHVRRFAELKYRGSLRNATLTDRVCDKGCGRSLKKWFDTVTVACSHQSLEKFVPTRVGGIIWAGWNETCLTEPSTGKNCNDVLAGFTKGQPLTKIPRSELCSWCKVHKLALMQSSAYSSYDENWKSDLDYIYQTCGLTGPTEIPPPLVSIPPKPPVLCASYFTYTTGQGDTCDSIAEAQNVSSAALYMGNENLLDCNLIPPEVDLCMPFACGRTYTLQPGENCTSIEQSLGLPSGHIRQYNPWLELGCESLQVSSAVFGHVLCLGVQGGKFTATAPIPGPTLLPGLETGYTNVVIKSPDNAKGVAPGTTLRCGRWRVARDDASCATMCIQDKIAFDLFLKVNPSLSGTDCNGKLVAGYAYCTGPVYGWNGPELTRPTDPSTE